MIVKEEKLEQARLVFADTQVNVTSSGQKHLGAVIGNSDYQTVFVNKLVDEWVEQIKQLSEIALFEPHAAYSAFTSCIRHKYTYFLRTIPQISTLLEPLESAIRNLLIPALSNGRSVTDDERLLLSLPVRLGGMGIVLTTRDADRDHEFSKKATSVLTNAIIEQRVGLPEGFLSKKAKS